MPFSQVPTIDPELWGPVPERPYVQAAVQLAADPDAVQAALDEFDAILRRRAERRRADTRRLVAELYARHGVNPSPERVDAEAEVACAQERDERLAAELRRLVTPEVAVVRRARTLTDRELDEDCQAALRVLATAPPSLLEFQPQAEQRYAAERALLDGFATQEAEVAGRLEETRGWQLRRRRRLRRELARAGRGRRAAEHRVRAAAARLAAVQARQPERDECLAQPRVRAVLGTGAAALRELHDRAQVQEVAATAELPVVDRPVTPGAAR